MNTEEYKVDKASVRFSPPHPLPTTQLTFNVQPMNNPPTPVPQMKVLRSSSQSGTGSEIEQTNPPRTLYGRVNLNGAAFDTLKAKLQQPTGNVYVRYQSDVVTGNDPIHNFEPIYVP